jgi:hypothetical protein
MAPIGNSAPVPDACLTPSAAVAWIMTRDWGEVTEWSKASLAAILSTYGSASAVTDAYHGSATPRPFHLSPAHAWADLREALRDERITATGIPGDGGDRDKITGMAWTDLEPVTDASCSGDEFRRRREPDRTAWLDALLPRANVLALWPPPEKAEPGSVPTPSPPTTAAEQPLSARFATDPVRDRPAPKPRVSDAEADRLWKKRVDELESTGKYMIREDAEAFAKEIGRPRMWAREKIASLPQSQRLKTGHKQPRK